MNEEKTLRYLLKKQYISPNTQNVFKTIYSWWIKKREEIEDVENYKPPFNYPVFLFSDKKIFLIKKADFSMDRIIDKDGTLKRIMPPIEIHGHLYYHIDKDKIESVSADFEHPNVTAIPEGNTFPVENVCLGNLTVPEVRNDNDLDLFHNNLKSALSAGNYQSPLNSEAFTDNLKDRTIKPFLEGDDDKK